MTVTPGGCARAGALLWIMLVIPPIQHLLQSTMTGQMLVQLPLLTVAGCLAARAVPQRIAMALARWNAQGIAGLLLASLAGGLWMLPRLMDASVTSEWIAVAKSASVPLLVGMPLALSWPRAGFVVRGVFLLESIATAFRLGWLYLASPTRLCSNYLLDDQQLLGRALVAVGVVLCLLLGWKLVWGRVRVAP